MVFVTGLSPGECLQVLQRQAALPRNLSSSTSEVRVTMHGYGFRLSTLGFYEARPFDGTIEPDAAGGRIQGGFGGRWRRLYTVMLLSLLFPLEALSIAIIGSMAVLWNVLARLTGYSESPWSTVGSLAIAGIMGSVGFAVIAWRARSVREADASIVDWIEKSFEATPQTKG